jgi:hypothetical protein
MSGNSVPNARLTPLQGAHFFLEADPAIIEDANQFRGRDHQLSIIYMPGNVAALRVHDEFTPGGRYVVPEVSTPLSPVPPTPPALPGTQVAAGSPMPASLPQPVPPPDYVFAEVATGNTVVDLSSWAPAGLTVGQRVVVRKVDNGTGRLTYTCPQTGITYDFANQRGEFLTLIWCGTTFHIG